MKSQRSKRAAKKTPAAAGGAKAATVPPAPKASLPPAAPAPRQVVGHTADAHLDALVGVWKAAHIEAKTAELAKDLARSPIAHVFQELELDFLRTTHGTIVAAARAGEVDYKALAIAQLGPLVVKGLEELHRKPAPQKVPSALPSWVTEAGLA